MAMNMITCIRADNFSKWKPHPKDGHDERIVRYMSMHDGETLRHTREVDGQLMDWVGAGGRPWYWMCRTSSGLPKKIVVGESVCFISFKGLVIGYFDIVATGTLGEYSFDPAERNTEWGQQQGVIMANWHPGHYGPEPGFQGWHYTELRP
jgi:hypothetical protein